ncbi:MAG: VOC family protein [Clostridiales bacterium]|nr:VOC family protein [Clostridiales bacterium]
MIKGIGHNAMRVTDMEKALEFYCGIVGMKKVFDIHQEDGRPWIEYLKVGEGAFFELFYDGVKRREPAYHAKRIGYHHWCVSTNDLERLAQESYSRGWISEPKPGLGRDGNWNLWIHDPDGNALEFVKYSPESPHMKSNAAPYDYDRKGLTGIGHVAFTVSDMDASLNFYRDILGFKLICSLDNESGEPWLNYLRVSDGSYIELFYGGQYKAKCERDDAGFMHLCLECDDVPATVADIRGKGAPIDNEPKQGKDLNTQAWTHDPDGNKVELMSIHPDSPQAKASMVV